MSGQTELQLVKMKLSITGRPSFISSGSETLRRSSRQQLIHLLVLHADDRRIQLHARGHTAREAGIGMLVDAPSGSNAPPTV